MLSRVSRLTGRNVICRTDDVTGTRTASRDAIVGKLQDPKSRHSYLKKKKKKKKSLFLTLSINIIQPLVLVHTGLTRTRTFYELYLREKLNTKDYTHRAKKKKRNTIILYSRSAFCLQFHFNLLFVNLPSTLRKALHTCAQKKLQKKWGGERERRHHFC